MNEIKQYGDNNFNDKYKYLLDKNILKLDTDDNIKKRKCRPCNVFRIFNIKFFQ